MIIYMKKSYKKRSRKRSTKKRARRITRKAGDYSKLAKKLLKSKTERKIGLARESRPIREFMQRKPFGNPDADLVDGLTVELKRKRGQIEGMALARQEALAKHRAKRRRIEPHPQAKKMTGSFTLGKRNREGGKRKRKTRRRRRRRR